MQVPNPVFFTFWLCWKSPLLTKMPHLFRTRLFPSGVLLLISKISLTSVSSLCKAFIWRGTFASSSPQKTQQWYLDLWSSGVVVLGFFLFLGENLMDVSFCSVSFLLSPTLGTLTGVGKLTLRSCNDGDTISGNATGRASGVLGFFSSVGIRVVTSGWECVDEEDSASQDRAHAAEEDGATPGWGRVAEQNGVSSSGRKHVAEEDGVASGWECVTKEDGATSGCEDFVEEDSASSGCKPLESLNGVPTVWQKRNYTRM